MIGTGALLLLLALAAFFVAVPVALADRRWGYAVTAAGSVLLAAAGIAALTIGPFTAASWSGIIGEPESLRLDALSGFFALVAAVVWTATSVYSLRYDDRPTPSLAMAYALTLGSIAILLASTDFVLFLAAWEGMTLSAYWMILEAHGDSTRVFSAAFVFLAFGEASTVLIAVTIGALYAQTGTFAMTAVTVVGPLASLAFVAALVGFGLKMGVAPFHLSEWLPIAHSSAPSNASAVLSSTLTLAGVYGLFRVLTLLGPGPDWWGALLLAIGAISALLGAVFAAVSEHSKGLPAYSTIENNGLILVALGIALIAQSDGLTTLATFALFAALFQAFAHAVTKAALFLFAGEVERTVHTFDRTEARGGIADADRPGSAAGLVAALSLAAAPPLAGFVSEWMILESLFQSYRFSQPWLQFIGLLAGAVVALAAGLVLVAMLKFIGFTTLWKPVRPRPGSRTGGLGFPIVGLACVVVGLGVFSPWVLSFVAPAASTFFGAPTLAPVGGLLAIPTGWSIVSSAAPFGILSPPALLIALAVGVLPAAAYFAFGRRRQFRVAPAWSGGREPPGTSQAYTSFAYSTGLRIMLRGLVGTRELRRPMSTPTAASLETASPNAYNVELDVRDPFKAFYDGLRRLFSGTARLLKRSIMPGQIGRYLAYLLVVVMLVIIYVAVVN